MHTNFSTKAMRAEGGLKVIESTCDLFANKIEEHLSDYGVDYERRLTGLHMKLHAMMHLAGGFLIVQQAFVFHFTLQEMGVVIWRIGVPMQMQILTGLPARMLETVCNTNT